MTLETEKLPEKTKPEKLVGIEKEPKNQVLDLEMLSFVKKHIGIDELAGFDPELELKEASKIIAGLKIASGSASSRETRRFFVEEFRKRLRKFRENVSQAQNEMETLLRHDPDAPKDILFQKIDEIMAKNDIKSQKPYFYQALSEYLLGREIISSTVSAYKNKFGTFWENNLFQDLFGFSPIGKVEIEVLPISILIKTYEEKDYLGVEGKQQNQISHKSLGTTLLGKRFAKVPQLNNRVLILNLALISDEDKIEDLKTHEEEHLIHNLYPAFTFTQEEHAIIEDLTHGKVCPVPKLESLMKRWAGVWNKDWQQFAKSEILAYFKEGLSVLQIANLLKNPFGIYNFFNVFNGEEEFKKAVIGHINLKSVRIVDANGQVWDTNLINTLAKTVITKTWMESYKAKLNNALNALERLEQIYGKTPEGKVKILRLISQEPLEKWLRLAKLLS